MSSFLRRFCASIALGTLLVPAACVLAAPAAQAETYRYWSYWHASGGSWTMSTSGSGSHVPKEGSVEGWRFIKSGGNASEPTPPRPKPSFESICARTAPKEGTKRVAVVIDYGTAKAAPQGAHPPVQRAECARVPKDADGNEVLAAVASEQYGSSGMVCSIDGYPQGACGGAGASGGSASSSQDGQGQGAREASGAGVEAQGGDTGGSGDSGDSGGTTGNGEAGTAASTSSSDEGLPVSAVVGVAIGGLLIGVLGGAAVLRMRKAR